MTSPHLRQIITSSLQSILKSKDVKKYEEDIHIMCVKISEESGEDLDSIYAQHAYEKVGELREGGDKKQILEDIRKNNTGFDSSCFSKIKNDSEIDAKIITEGMKIKKGDIPCKNSKCKSTETYYYSQQTRSADEASSIYLICVSCGSKSRIQ